MTERTDDESANPLGKPTKLVCAVPDTGPMPDYEPIRGHRLIIRPASDGDRGGLFAQCSCEGNLGLPVQYRESPEVAIAEHDKHCERVRQGDVS